MKKKLLPKILSVFLAVTLLFLAIMQSAAFGSNYPVNPYDAESSRRFAAGMKANKALVGIFMADGDDIVYPDDYGGRYFDEKGYFYVLTTKENFDDISFLSDNPDIRDCVIYKYAPHSYNNLRKLQTFLDSYMLDLDISTTGVIEPQNILEIGLLNLQSSEDVLNLLRSNFADFDESMVIVVQGEKLVLTYNYAEAGSKTFNRYGLLNLFHRNTGTIGFNAYDNRTGRYGIVTNAHVAEQGLIMRNWDDQEIGTAMSTRWQRSGNLDAAFIPFPDSSWRPSPYIQWPNPGILGWITASYPASDIPYGAPVGKSGNTTGYTFGTVTNVSRSATVEGVAHTDVFETSNTCQGGDSGGPMFNNNNYDPEYGYLFGITFAGPISGAYTLGIKAGHILNTFQLTLVTW